MLTSPNHPGNYPDNLKKTETIQVKQGLILSLQFTAFDIRHSSLNPNCLSDHLTITDGDGTTLMEKSCGPSSYFDGSVVIGGQSIGSSLPPAIRSRSNLINLVFTTGDWAGGLDGLDTRTGWSVSWSAVKGILFCFLQRLKSLQKQSLHYRRLPCPYPNHWLYKTGLTINHDFDRVIGLQTGATNQEQLRTKENYFYFHF